MNLFQLLPLLLVMSLSSTPELGGSSTDVMDGPSSRIRCLEVERKALLKFKDELVDTNGRLSSWGDQENRYECCKWIGVHCHNKTNHVTRLDLNANPSLDLALRGTISISLLELQHLAYLDLSFNDFLSAPIPEFICSLRNLRYLNLSSANFVGPIPHHLGNLSKLRYLDLDGIKMHCPIPDIFEKISLVHLDLSNTRLDGGIPKYLGNMSSLMYLDLGGNDLAGKLFDVTMNLTGELEKSLKYLDLSWNSINGFLPNMSRFPLLEVLRLQGNQLNGSIQEGYLHLPYLLSLDLSYNRFTGAVPNLSVSPSLKQLALVNNMFNNFTDIIGGLPELEGLWIGSNSLEGMITETHMLNLSRLTELDLSNNSFLILKFNPHWVPPFQLKSLSLRGCNLGPYFPQWLKTQKQLNQIDISSSGISDIIPSWFGGIASILEYLNISNNQIHDEFPEISFLSEDRRIVFDLSNNSISGSATFLCYNTEWGWLDLSDNMFSGQIPDCFSKFHKLQGLNLANNHFSGEISNLFGSACPLALLQLRNNSFSGGLPISLSNCLELHMIDLGENRLTKTIPDWLGVSLSKLIVLILRSNELNGSIPASLCGLANIQILDLSSNKITGVIPKSIGNFTAMTKTANDYDQDYSTFIVDGSSFAFSLDSAYFMWKGKETMYSDHVIGLVKMIDLSSNNLECEIPSSITILVGLIGLNISRNNLTGFIPKNIGQLASLNFLDLSRNHLRGGIPTSLSKLNRLGTLNLSYNNLSGRIPRSGHAHTFNKSSCIRNDGSPMYKQEQEDDDDDELMTEGFYVAIVFVLGFIVGFWGIFGAILLNKELRYAFLGMLNSLETLCT